MNRFYNKVWDNSRNEYVITIDIEFGENEIRKAVGAMSEKAKKEYEKYRNKYFYKNGKTSDLLLSLYLISFILEGLNDGSDD